MAKSAQGALCYLNGDMMHEQYNCRKYATERECLYRRLPLWAD